LVGRVVASGMDRSRRKPVKDWVAYDFYLQGRERFDQHDSWAAEALLRRAIDADPAFAQAQAWLSMAYTTAFFFSADDDVLKLSEIHARKAVSLDNADAAAHAALGSVELFLRRHDEAGTHFAFAVSLNPTNARIVTMYCAWLGFVGRMDEALAMLEESLRRDPFATEWYWECRSATLMEARRYDEAIQSLAPMRHKLVWNHYLLAASCAYLGRMTEAREHAAEVLRLKPDYSEDWVRAIEPHKDPAHLEHLLHGLRMAGLPSDGS
jgi:adenylate cyclase